MDALPGEEDSLGSMSLGQAHSLPGSHVVGLLVNVDNVGLYSPELFGQARVEVQVEVAVESHPLHNQLVPLSVLPLQAYHPSLVAPVGWYDDGEFHVGKLCSHSLPVGNVPP